MKPRPPSAAETVCVVALAWVGVAALLLTPADGSASGCRAFPVYSAPAYYAPVTAHNAHTGAYPSADVVYNAHIPAESAYHAPRDVFLFIPAFAPPVAVQPVQGSAGALGFQGTVTPGEPPPPRATGYADGRRSAPAPFDPARAAGALQLCAACHTGPRGKGGVQLFDDAGRFAPSAAPAVILAAIDSGSMPPRGPRPTGADVALLREWAGQ